MLREFLRAKIHRAVVSEAALDYVGSITINKKLCEKIGLGNGEKVDVLNISTGARISTYVIYGEKEKYFCLNGAAARRFSPGDRIIIINYCMLSEEEIVLHTAHVAVMDDENNIVEILEVKTGG